MFNLFCAGFCLAFTLVAVHEKNWVGVWLGSVFTIVNLIVVHLLINIYQLSNSNCIFL